MSAAEQLIRSTIDTLRQYAPFDTMEPVALRSLAERLKLAYFARDAIVVGPDEGPVRCLRIVKQGAIRGAASTALQSGTLVDVVLGPGECFPLGALVGRRPTVYVYRAVEDAFVYELEEEDFREIMARSLRFQRFCNEYLAGLVDESRRALRTQLAQTLTDEGRLLTPLARITARTPVFCAPHTPIAEVLQTMHKERIGAMVVVDEVRAPSGIFTQPDVLERVALARKDLSAPIASVMTPNPICLPSTAPIYEAAVVMARHGIRHVLVVDDGKLSGIVSERDLFVLQRASMRRAAERIRSAEGVEALVGASEDIRAVTRNLLAHGMGAEQLTQVVSALNDALTQRVIELLARQHRLEGDWCWIALGSEGRMEQTLATDQDNGLVLGRGANDRKRFLAFADDVNRALERCGFPLCKGDIMARNPKWCLTLEEWRLRFSDWILNPKPQALLHAAIFFDLRVIAGDAALVQSLREWLLEHSAASKMFQRWMVQNALEARPPIGLLRDFVTEDAPGHPGTIDLKKLGVRPIVDAARVWALAHRVGETGTAGRLRAVARLGALPKDEADASIEAFHYIQGLRLRNQHVGSSAADPGNRIDPESLNALDRRILKAALRQVAKLQERLRLDYQL